MQRLIWLASFILFCCVATAHAQTTQPGLAMRVSSQGDIALLLGGKPVASGHWYLTSADWQAGEGDQIPVGSLVSSAGVQQSATHAVITNTFTSAKTVCDLQLDGSQLRLTQHIENLDRTHALKKAAFHGLVFNFDREPTGSIPSWHWTYMQAHDNALFHPSTQAPLGVVYAHDDRFGFSAFSDSEFDSASMINAGWQKQGVIPAQCEVEFYTQRPVPAGGKLDVDICFCISGDTSIANLLGGYKADIQKHFPMPLFHEDHRAMAQFASVGPQMISPSNPLGFNGGFRRLDSSVGVNAYLRLVAPPLHQANALGIIFWGLGGWNPPMYPPDFDQFPRTVQATIPSIVAGLKRYGLRAGLCARCGEGITRTPGKDPLVYRLKADNPADMNPLLNRFAHAMDMGFDIFYLDNFGGEGENDLSILKQVRAKVGPDVLLYTEYCTDMSLAYADHYCEWTKGSIMWTTPQAYEALRFLYPDSTWLCMSREGRPIPFEFAKLGLTPLVQDAVANRLPASQPVR